MSVLRRCIFNEKEKKWITQIFFMEKNGQFAVIVLQMEIFPEDIARHLKMVRLPENIRHMVI